MARQRFNLTGPGIESQTSGSDSGIFNDFITSFNKIVFFQFTDSRKEKKFVSHKATQTCKIHTKSVGVSWHNICCVNCFKLLCYDCDCALLLLC